MISSATRVVMLCPLSVIIIFLYLLLPAPKKSSSCPGYDGDRVGQDGFCGHRHSADETGVVLFERPFPPEGRGGGWWFVFFF